MLKISSEIWLASHDPVACWSILFILLFDPFPFKKTHTHTTRNIGGRDRVVAMLSNNCSRWMKRAIVGPSVGRLTSIIIVMMIFFPLPAV